MSFLVGPLSGALVAGGVYFGFSNLINTRTEKHQRDLRRLTLRLTETPPPASARIEHNQLSSYIKSKWNQEIAYLVAGFSEWDRRAVTWGRGTLYGLAGGSEATGGATSKDSSSQQTKK